MNPLRALDFKDKQEAKNDLRILELLPNLIRPLAVDPGIPADFIALAPRGTLDPYDWIYWGPEEVLKSYFENPTSLKEPILRVKLSTDVVQTGPNSFDHTDLTQFFKTIKKEFPNDFASMETQWGDYPVFAFRANIEGKLGFLAWVGLNVPEAGWTLMFNLVYPNQKGQPNEESYQLWENLLTKTTELKDGDYFKARGQDLQEGYTVANIGGTKVRMLAEKRKSDGTMQVVVIPVEPNVEFHYVNMMECAMGAKWKFGEPMVKVYGQFVVNRENSKCTIDYVTSIFFKTVEEFSYKIEEGKKPLIFQKICEKIV